MPNRFRGRSQQNLGPTHAKSTTSPFQLTALTQQTKVKHAQQTLERDPSVRGKCRVLGCTKAWSGGECTTNRTKISSPLNLQISRTFGVAYLGGEEHTECQTIQEVTGRQQAADWTQREARAFLQKVGDVLLLWDVVHGVATVAFKKWHNVVEFVTRVALPQILHARVDDSPRLDLQVCMWCSHRVSFGTLQSRRPQASFTSSSVYSIRGIASPWRYFSAIWANVSLRVR